MIRVSRLADSVKPSATLAAGAKARELKAKGITVYDFSLGEPDFNTPKHICDAASEAMAKGHTHYTPAGGTAELRKTIANWYGRTYGFTCGPENVIVSNGAKHSIHNALIATVGPGDEVIIPAPYWVSYSDLVEMTGARYRTVPTSIETGFKMTPKQLQDAITPQTRLLMLNSPSNPTGAVYTRGELDALAEIVLKYPDVTVLSDEIYEQLCYGNAKPTCFVTLRPELRERTITVSGASKSYAMTGWRMGWAVAPAPIVKAMDNVQSQETSCPSSISQAAMIVALESPESAKCIAEMLAEFSLRRDLVAGTLKTIPGLKVFEAEGAFYAFFGISEYFGKTFGNVKVSDSMTFCSALLEQAHVNLVPGIAFGAEGYARMSYATKRETIEAGLAKLKAWLASGV